MKKLITLLTGLSFLFIISTAVADYVYLDDGGDYIVNNDLKDSHFFLDYNIANIPGTRLELAGNGIVSNIVAHNNSSVEINGGTVNYTLEAHGNSNITVNSGTVNTYVHSSDSSTFSINGGIFHEQIRSHDNGRINISGGLIDSYLTAEDGRIYLYGSDFRVNGISLGYGTGLRQFGILDSYRMWLKNTITGALQDGSELNLNYYILNSNDGDIIVIPEPATLLLLGLGGLALRKRKEILPQSCGGEISILVGGRNS